MSEARILSEWKVGHKSRYEDLDTKMYRTGMSMSRSEAPGITAESFALSMKNRSVSIYPIG